MVAVPSIFRTEAVALLIASVRPLTVPVRSSVPLLAVSVPAFAIDMLTVPEPLMLVFAGDGAQAADRAAGERDAVPHRSA